MSAEHAGAPISVVIPVWNDAACLARLLADLRAAAAFELVVVDGGSDDGSFAVAEERADVALRAPRGRAAQMRAGAAKATHAWLWFLHADTRVAPLVASEFARNLPQTPGWGWCDVRLEGAAWPLRVIEKGMNWRSALTGITTGDQGIFAHRNLLQAVGGIPNQRLMEDVELCRRLRRLAPPRRFRSAITTSSRRWEHHGIVRTVTLMWALRLRYLLGADPNALAKRYYP